MNVELIIVNSFGMALSLPLSPYISTLLLLITNHLFLYTSAFLRYDANATTEASNDYGNIIHIKPYAVLYPSSVQEIVSLVRSSYGSNKPFYIAARGISHSVRGQAMAPGGVVVYMPSLGKSGNRINISGDSSSGFYADVGGEVQWIDVLHVTNKRGLAPVTWTDYLYLTVGGVLSNAGISGQSFLHGPHINNVLELDVITGKGEFITCSKEKNPQVFLAVLGGLGQFGIITRARIALDKAPSRAKWVRLIYSDFSSFSSDQELLISIHSPNYVEGFLITNESITDQWRVSFSTPSNQSNIVALLKKQKILYSIELVKYYDDQSAATIDKDFDALLKQLSFIPSFIFSTDSSFLDFINRVPNIDAPQVPPQSHPWLNLFIPKSRIKDFNAGVLTTIIPKTKQTAPVFIFYPLNRSKWDDRMSAVIPDEDVFYNLGLLHSSLHEDIGFVDDLNNQILDFCQKEGIQVKQYLPHYQKVADWEKHFGSKWATIKQRKANFDPKSILSPGQRIFNSVSSDLLGLFNFPEFNCKDNINSLI